MTRCGAAVVAQRTGEDRAVLLAAVAVAGKVMPGARARHRHLGNRGQRQAPGLKVKERDWAGAF